MARRLAVLDSYATRLGGLPETAFVGSLAWFSITGVVDHEDGRRTSDPVRVRREWLVKKFDELNLDKSILPAAPGKIHSFRSACTHASGRRYIATYDRDVSVELLIRDVSADGEKVEKQVTLERKDPKGARLEYKKVATITFYRGNIQDRRVGGGHFKTRVMAGLSNQDQEEVEALISDLKLKFDDLAAHLHGNMVRGIVRNYLRHLNAIPIKDGLYFTHRSRQPEMDSLMTLVRSIGQGCVFGQCPLVDTDEQREMLSAAYQDDVADQCRLLMEDVAAANEKGKITPALYSRLMDDWRRVSDRSMEYSDQLGLAQERAGTALEMSLEGILALGKVVVEK